MVQNDHPVGSIWLSRLPLRLDGSLFLSHPGFGINALSLAGLAGMLSVVQINFRALPTLATSGQGYTGKGAGSCEDSGREAGKGTQCLDLQLAPGG